MVVVGDCSCCSRQIACCCCCWLLLLLFSAVVIVVIAGGDCSCRCGYHCSLVGVAGSFNPRSKSDCNLTRQIWVYFLAYSGVFSTNMVPFLGFQLVLVVFRSWRLPTGACSGFPRSLGRYLWSQGDFSWQWLLSELLVAGIVVVGEF